MFVSRARLCVLGTLYLLRNPVAMETCASSCLFTFVHTPGSLLLLVCLLLVWRVRKQNVLRVNMYVKMKF